MGSKGKYFETSGYGIQKRGDIFRVKSGILMENC